MTHSNEVPFEGYMNNWGLWYSLSKFWNALTLGKQEAVVVPWLLFTDSLAYCLLDGCLLSLLVIIPQGVIH